MQSAFTRRLLLVEDEQLTRSLLESFLASNGFEVRGAASANEASKIARDFDPDAMVVDISLGDGPSGLDLIHAMKNANPHIAFVVLSNYSAPPTSIKNLPRVAYLQKRSVADPSTLLDALESVLADRDPKNLYPFANQSPLANLTSAQIEALAWIADGLSNQEIANRRGTTIQAAEQLIGRIYDKLELKRDSGKSLRVQATGLYSSTVGSRVVI